jgi:hypothetical protein
MPEAVAQPEASIKPLSQVQRVVDTLIAPSKTFRDIQRSANWLLPYVIAIVVTLGLGFAIQQKIGWSQTVQNMLKASPKQTQQLEQLPPEQQAKQITIRTAVTKYTFWATPAVALIIALIAVGVLLGTINFGFGGRAKFGQMMAVWMFATLPWSIQGILGIITIYAGVDPESFNLQNFVGTNIGYYLSQDLPKWLIALATAVDATTIWSLVLLTIGCAIVGKVKRGQAATAVFGWWVIIVALKVVGAMFS